MVQMAPLFPPECGILALHKVNIHTFQLVPYDLMNRPRYRQAFVTKYILMKYLRVPVNHNASPTMLLAI